MASSMGAHAIAKIGHANVKPPVDPYTSMPDTMREREERQKLLQSATEHANDALTTVGGDKIKASQILDLKLQATNEMIAQLAQNSKQMSDEDFYQQLTALKEEHRKTLDMCEHMYKMKTNASSLQTRAYARAYLGDSGEQGIQSEAALETQSSAFPVTQSMDYLINAYRQRDEWDESHQMAASLPIRRGPTSKPPTGSNQRPRTAGNAGRSRKSRVAWRETRASTLRRRCHSADNLIAEIQREENRGDLEPVPRETESTASSEAVTRIHRLWDEEEDTSAPPPGPLKRVKSLDRSISDYNRRKAFERRKEKAEESMTRDEITAKWRHRVTIPEPFNFSVRDEYLNKTKTVRSYEDELTKREQSELAECQKKFKANPVPAHVYMPMYESLMERQESRRQFVKQNRQEILQSIQEPFHFDQRETEKKRQKELQGKNNSGMLRSRKGERSKSVPRAKEVPTHIFEDRSERMREDQLLRQIKAKMRADELMQKSALPGQMAERENAKKEKMKQKTAMKTNDSSVNQFRPRTRNVPNFNKIHSRLAKEKGIHQGELRCTRPEPFKLRTDERIRPDRRSMDQADNSNMNRRSYDDWNQSILLSQEIPQAQMTNSANIRDRCTRDRLADLRRKEMEEEEQWRRQKKRHEEMARYLKENIGLIDAKKEVGDLTGRKSQALRQDQLRRSREYEHEVRDMEERVKKRPLLVERQAQLCAKKQAELKYANILKDAGVNETFVEDKGAAYRPEDVDGYDQFEQDENDDAFGGKWNGRVEENSNMFVERDNDLKRSYPEETASLSVSDRFGPADDEIVEDIEEVGSGSEFGGKLLA